MLETFITSAIPEFVANCANGVTFERFVRSCDMTYLLKCLEVFECNPSVVLSKQCLKWFVDGENHAEAFVDLVLHFRPDAIPTFDRLLEQSDIIPSEFVIAELISRPQFKCPTRWLNMQYNDRKGQKQLLRAIAAQVDCNISVLQLFVNNQVEHKF
jgi:hypothetical protein